ncbi:hypothetical protein [Paraurantiacibacter namhicola]|uniref:ABC-2 family transporter protein n=1 Tax=Paraurantiacibacter namhicola TaxID=645517 RepID=A0A1C7D6Z9_9SPHN|nr:hypothetical protein [Paraurantiacibacter namhicola]ANU07250.1 hypothetical protein A6F65_00940 [Paraurantiacibacter namhicola]
MSYAVARSAFGADMSRYARSKSLWLMLLAAPVAARFMISPEEGEGFAIAIDNQLPVLNSGVMGIWLGIVVSVIVMPIAYIYLRASPTRRRPWQVVETSPASMVSVSLGRFAADSAVLLAMLAALSLAGIYLGWMMVSGAFEPLRIFALTWLVAGPTFLAVAAIRTLFDARPWLRGAAGDVAFFFIWMASLVYGSVNAQLDSGFLNNLGDIGGAVRPLVEGGPPGAQGFAIGTTQVDPGRVELDVARGIGAEGYLASRAAWVGLAVLIAGFAGLVYRPHTDKPRKQRFAFLAKLSPGNLQPGAKPSATPAPHAAAPWIGLLLAEMRLIASGPLFPILAVAAALSGLAPDFRHVGSAAILLLLAFGLSSHAGRAEAKGLLALTATAAVQPMARRIAFVIAGTGIAAILAIPAVIASASAAPMLLILATGASASLIAAALSALTGSAFVARLVLLIVWYGYFAS